MFDSGRHSRDALEASTPMSRAQQCRALGLYTKHADCCLGSCCARTGESCSP